MRLTDEQSIGEYVLHPKYQGKSVSESASTEDSRQVLREMLARKNGPARYFILDTIYGRRAEKCPDPVQGLAQCA